jgi:hypothetical protein
MTLSAGEIMRPCVSHYRRFLSRAAAFHASPPVVRAERSDRCPHAVDAHAIPSALVARAKRRAGLFLLRRRASAWDGGSWRWP